jgi:hypothetical protein
MFQGNTQNQENYCRVRSAHQFWRVRRALGQTFSEQSRMSLRLSQNYEQAWWHRCPHRCGVGAALFSK